MQECESKTVEVKEGRGVDFPSRAATTHSCPLLSQSSSANQDLQVPTPSDEANYDQPGLLPETSEQSSVLMSTPLFLNLLLFSLYNITVLSSLLTSYSSFSFSSSSSSSNFLDFLLVLKSLFPLHALLSKRI